MTLASKQKSERMNDTLYGIIRGTLVDLIPVFIISTLSFIFYTLIQYTYGIEYLQSAAANHTFAKITYDFFKVLYEISFELQTLFLILFYCRHVCINKKISVVKQVGLILSMAFAFCLFSGFPNKYNEGIFGAQGAVIALISMATSFFMYNGFYALLEKVIFRKFDKDRYANVIFIAAFGVVLSMLVYLIFHGIILNIPVPGHKDISCFTEFLFGWVDVVLAKVDNNFGEQIMLIANSNALSFFGIQGKSAMAKYFTQIYDSNHEIITENFFKSFVLIGGSGASLCMVVSLIINAKIYKLRFNNFDKVSFGCTVFNANELMLFKLPVILNKYLVYPFIITPVVFFITSYFAVKFGIVPPPSNDVFISTPPLVNAYIATGSFWGVLLQLFNISLGIGIYYPFARLYVKNKVKIRQQDYEKLVELVKLKEENISDEELTNPYKEYAYLVNEIYEYIFNYSKHDGITMYYQPQYNEKERCIGAEALLRVKHPVYGNIYPPLIIQILKEKDVLIRMDEVIIDYVIRQFNDCTVDFGTNEKLKISINVSGDAIQDESFERFLLAKSKMIDFDKYEWHLEVAERDALSLDFETASRLKRIRNMGYKLAIDDFSMGWTSIHYLTKDYFDVIKLDGSIVKDICENDRTKEIIMSTVELSQKLNIDLIAEYVSNKEIRDTLHNLGCNLYQGYYYSPAITKDDFLNLLACESNNEKREEKCKAH